MKKTRLYNILIRLKPWFFELLIQSILLWTFAPLFLDISSFSKTQTFLSHCLISPFGCLAQRLLTPQTYQVHNRICHLSLEMLIKSHNTVTQDLIPPSALPLSNHQKSQRFDILSVLRIFFILSYITLMQAFITFLLCHCNRTLTGLLPSLTKALSCTQINLSKL